MRRRFLLIVVGAVLLVGCKEAKVVSSDSQKVSESLSMAESQTESEIQTEFESQIESELEEEVIAVTISAVGDVMFGSHQRRKYKNSFQRVYDENGEDYFLKNVKQIFEADDFTIVNYEGTLTNSEDAMEKDWNHKGDPKYVSILTNGSVEAVTLGNNHIMDYGEQGIKDTISTFKEAGIVYALSGEYGDQVGIYRTESGINIGFVSVNVHYEERKCYEYLEKGFNKLKKKGANLILAMPHWGDDMTHEPNEIQLEMGKWCIDLGYDVVLACHPHLLQGIEVYNGKYIVHSMGSFSYGGNKNPKDKDSMIWQQTFYFKGNELIKDEAHIIPCSLSSMENKNDYCPVVLDGEQAKALFKRLNTYCERFNTYVDDDGIIYTH